MTETERFFQELSSRGHEPLLAKVTGRVRFDVDDDGRPDRWLITINRGDVTVAHTKSRKAAADCTVRGDREIFDELAAGRANAMAAVLRGALTCTGDVELMLAIQRIFPGPPSNRAERSPR
jgi:predicted lipid carrier protein YhbT